MSHPPVELPRDGEVTTTVARLRERGLVIESPERDRIAACIESLASDLSAARNQIERTRLSWEREREEWAARLSPPREGAGTTQRAAAVSALRSLAEVLADIGVLEPLPASRLHRTVEKLPRFIVRISDEDSERFLGAVEDPFGPWLRRADVLTLLDDESEEYPLNDKEWTDALLAGAAALEGVADATTGWQAHDARIFAARLRYRAEKILGPRNPPAPEADPNG